MYVSLSYTCCFLWERSKISTMNYNIYCVFQTSVGIKRLNKFMNCDELDESAVEHDAKERKLHLLFEIQIKPT